MGLILHPLLVHGVSVCLHVILLLLVVSYGRAQQRFQIKNTFPRIRLIIFCSVFFSAFNLTLIISTYFYETKWVTTLDVVLKSVSWAALAVSLRSTERVPGFLTSWCFFYFIASSYNTATDLVRVADTASLVSDAVSIFIAVFLGGVLSLTRVSGDTNLEEPLVIKEETKGCDEVTPFANAGFLNVLTFYWMGPLIKQGNQKTLDIVDVPQLYKKDSVFGMLSDFKRSIGSENDVTTLKLTAAVFSCVWGEVVLTGVLALVYTAASYVGPFLIDAFVVYINGKGEDRNRGYLLASAFFAAKLLECVSQRHWFFRMQRIGMRMRAVLVTEIYGKTLKLSSSGTNKQTTGEIVNLMAVDAERIDEFGWYLHDCWLVFVQVGFALAVLYRNLGMAAAATLLATVLVMLLNFPLGRLQEKYQGKLMKEKDGRMKSTSEILRNMRILKLQGWEMKFLEKIMGQRKTEEGWIRKYVYNSAFMSFAFWAAPSLVAGATFGSCIVLGIPLVSGKILSALATFRVLQEPIYQLPDCISMFIQTKVSLDRIAAFLRLPDIDVNNVENLPIGASEAVVEVANGDFSWESSSSRLTLEGLNLEVRRGMHVAVCGTVGSGKSSLLSCILGELPKLGGTLKVCGKKAYVAQSPWIQSGKIEDNILFGEKMDREKYDRVIEACCLRKDLDVLPFGDQTVIGERGINLSGGQKQRIQIARAIYQDADIYLFDDPFSAVDAHTGSHLFKEVLRGILSSKTVIYVTHQVEFLPSADLILVMKNGRISEKGKYGEILASDSDFKELVGAHHAALSALNHRQTEETETNDGGDIEEEENTKVSNDGEVRKQLVEEEEREKGKVGFRVYLNYLTTAYGGALVPLIILFQIIFQVVQIASNYWMAWATPVTEDAKQTVNTSTLLIVYSSLALISALCILCRSTLTATAGYKTATILFQKMHHCIFRAPMAFFDATPSGRILNRASTDQSTIDLQIAYDMGTTAFSTVILLGVIAVMSQVAWQVFGVFVPVVAACIWYQQYYISSARELSRLVGVTKAPVIQHFAETISGSTTIRSFDQQIRFANTNMKLTDEYSRPKFHIAAAMEWLCFRLNMLTSATFAFSLIFLVLFPDRINPAVAGLAITYGLNLNSMQAWVIWTICNLENKVISVERVLQYTSIASEPPLVIEENRPHPSWPSKGEIRLNSLHVRYADHLPLVIRGLSCTFHGGEKIGIVGRTGSGKSTLIQALFRIVEPVSGSIEIDGIDIRSIGVHDLRTRLSIIPQDPTMFEGTVRGNLDPLGEYADTEIWEALEKCQLGDEVRKSPDKLDASVSENGENWSMGQRQLVCLGRVLLKKRKVLVLDEATASVDTFTDNLIQLTLKRHFWDCTVITIAHRITSVLDSHKVLVLRNGVVEEFDSPANLLANKSSSFSKLVAEYTARSSSILT